MAASDARPVPRKNAAFRFYFAIRKNDGTLITSWAGADSEVSLDGAAYSDCSGEATEIGTTGTGYIDFTAAEMNADCVIYKLTVTNTDALPLVVTFFPEEAGDYRLADTQKVDVNTLKTQAITCSAGVTVYAHVGTGSADSAQTGDSFARLGAPAGASVSADIAAMKAETAAIVADTGTDGVVVASGSKSGYALSASGLDAILIESGISAGASLTNDTGSQLTSINARQAIALAISVLAGVISDAGTGTEIFKPAGKPSGNTRLLVTDDEDGNRSALVLKVPD